MSNVAIRGGYSTSGKITILSEDHAGQAWWDGSQIHVSTHPHPAFARFCAAHPHWPIPRVLRMFAIFSSNLGWWRWLIAGMLLVLLVLTVLVAVIPASSAPVPLGPALTLPRAISSVVINLATVMVITALISLRVAKWHAAEHMVIAAYNRHGDISLGAIRRESRVDPHCGGRFLLPLIIVTNISTLVAYQRPELSLLYNLIAFEALLWLDHFFPLDRIWPFGQFSRWLQRVFTTAEPGNIEIHVARDAMLAVLNAHAMQERRRRDVAMHHAHAARHPV